MSAHVTWQHALDITVMTVMSAHEEWPKLHPDLRASIIAAFHAGAIAGAQTWCELSATEQAELLATWTTGVPE